VEFCDDRAVPAEEQRRKTGTQAIERAIAILRLFADTDTPLSLTTVARSAALTPATAHRILGTLVRERLLSHDADSERYRIGPDSLFLFAAAARRFGIVAARSELEALVATVHETAAIGVIDGSDTLVVLQVESDLPLRFSRPVGTRVPVHASAMGKAILAFSDEGSPEGIAALGDLNRFTPHTITSRKRLRSELDEVRARGWAVNDSERYDGVRAIAVPIVHQDGRATAAVGLQGPASRLPDTRTAEVVGALQRTAESLSRHVSVSTL
jgi:IclR family acetate operon transcriptional repressor